jgi:hypothetical protein
MDPKKLLVIALGAAVALATGCATQTGDEEAEEQEGQLRPLERKAIGKAVDYPADKTLKTQLDTLTKSQKARRAAAWKAVARTLKPVTVSESTLKTTKIPLFRTWYGRDDFERIFGKMYSDRTAADRKARKPFTIAEANKAFDVNAKDLGSSSEKDYFERIKKINDPNAVQGLAGNHRVAYSPGLFRHVLGEYGNLFNCLPKIEQNLIKADAEPPSKTNFAPCMNKEFPDDAALVKMSWYRANFGSERLKLPVYKTDAATLTAKMKGTDPDQGGWGKGVGDADPKDEEIYTVQMSDGTKFRMPAMHIVTKELREWLWITIWWSPDANEDFGEDRPAEIKALGAPWGNYKMNVSVAYEEMDPDPKGGFTGTLGAAIAASYTGKGNPSWVSNPYLEKGPLNAQSNCIGCHQHAGTNESTESILADQTKFPKASRTKLRKNFPADYLWALTSAPERLVGVVDDQVRHYDGVDR